MKSSSLARALAAAVSMAAAPSLLHAQDTWSVPIDRARLIQVGETRAGDLSASDPKLDDGSHYDLWFITGNGQTVTVTMKSSAFDAYMAIGRHNGSIVDSDDDGAGGTDAQVVLSLDAGVTYVIRANSLSADQTGSYTVSVAAGGTAGGGGGGGNGGGLFGGQVPENRRIAADGRRSSSLDSGDRQLGDDSYFEAWTIQVTAGRAVTITMRSSDFDTFLQVGPQGASEAQETNDDFEDGSTDSQISFTPSASGTYVIIANSLEGGETGNYSLEVSGVGGGSGGGSGGGLADDMIGAMGGGTAGGNVLTMGRTVSGTLASSDPTLDDDSHYDEYFIEGRAGDRVVITMRSSAFDAFLTVRNMAGEVIESNDDGEALGGSTDAQIVFTFPSAGRFKVYANSLGAGETGAYTITLARP